MFSALSIFVKLNCGYVIKQFKFYFVFRYFLGFENNVFVCVCCCLDLIGFLVICLFRGCF